jgi:hypothetical protein
MKIPRGALAGFVVGLLVLGVSCKNNPPIGPSGGGTTGGTSPPTGPATTGLILDGPRSVAPNTTAQLTLTAQFSDGTTKDVTRDAVWTSSSTARVTIAAGLATGRTPGEANITARYTPPGQFFLTRSKELIVVPDGTFRVVGRVLESGLGIPIPGARVTVRTGNAAGQVTTVFGDGRFRLYGLAGQNGIEARQSGYRDDFRDIVITDHDQSIDFVLIAGASPEGVEGSYTLTLAASAGCRDALPEEARVRVYDAELTRTNGRILSVALSGATLSSNRFSGRIDPIDLVTFQFGDPYYYYYSPLIERMGTNQLQVSGFVNARLMNDRIAGTMSGLIDLRTDRGVRLGACSAPDHSFELRRR